MSILAWINVWLACAAIFLQLVHVAPTIEEE
jgi:hypothetical protein